MCVCVHVCVTLCVVVRVGVCVCARVRVCSVVSLFDFVTTHTTQSNINQFSSPPYVNYLYKHNQTFSLSLSLALSPPLSPLLSSLSTSPSLHTSSSSPLLSSLLSVPLSSYSLAFIVPFSATLVGEKRESVM